MSFEVIALDLGGVLFSAGKEVAKTEWRQLGYDIDLIEKLLTSPESKDLRKGIIGDHEFWNIYVKSKVPDTYDVETIKLAYYRGYILDNDIVAMINRLKDKVTFVSFSGNIPSRIEYLDKQYQFRKLFKVECYSFDCGATKPDPYFVEYLIKQSFPKETSNITIKHGQPVTGSNLDLFKQLGNKILYLDDEEKDAKPAQDYNINTFIYTRGQIDKLYEKHPELK